MGLLSVIGTGAGAFFGGPVGAAVGGAIGSSLEGDPLADAANRQAAALERNAQLAAEAAKFRPVGITTRFGTSQFQKDAQGNIIGAGYTLSPDVQAQQNRLFGLSSGYLDQAEAARQATAPMGQAAQGLMGLGQGYLATSPQEQAQKYFAEQQGLLAPSRQAALAGLQNQQFQQGRTGLAVGGGAGRMATNPEMAAYYNAIAQQDAALAAQATQGGMDYAKFGAGLIGTGGGLLGSMYGTQQQALQPYRTAMGEVQGLEAMGQQALDVGINVGAKGQANASSAQLLQQGMGQAAAVRAASESQDRWGGLLSGVSSGLSNMNVGQRIGDWWSTTPGSAVSSEVSSLGSSTWNPYSDYMTGKGDWGSYGE